jgi:hypothetical protein
MHVCMYVCMRCSGTPHTRLQSRAESMFLKDRSVCMYACMHVYMHMLFFWHVLHTAAESCHEYVPKGHTCLFCVCVCVCSSVQICHCMCHLHIVCVSHTHIHTYMYMYMRYTPRMLCLHSLWKSLSRSLIYINIYIDL